MGFYVLEGYEAHHGGGLRINFDDLGILHCVEISTQAFPRFVSEKLTEICRATYICE